MNRRSYKIVLLAVAAVLLVVASLFQGQINRQRTDPRLGLRPVALGPNAPPMLAFTTVALGGFRGLIANSLWVRANDLQNDGKYFEMVQLAEWITTLEPTFAQVWVVQAWNMAYNISVKFNAPEDRWQWVQRGIEILRDRGLEYNPHDALIYRELAWFFQHKMGANMDDAHKYFKKMWATQMNELLGSGRPNYEELIHPQTDTAKKRVTILREKYKMDPQLMKEVDERFGPLEWRLPEAHAIYWAAKGLQQSRKKDLITLRRVIYQSMAMSVERGRLISIDPIQFGPDLSKVDQALKAFDQMIAEDVEMRDAIKTAHKNFLKTLVYLLYSYNQINKAGAMYALLKQQYPGSVPDNVPLDEYALTQIAGKVREMPSDKFRFILEGMIVQHYHSLVIGEDDRAAGLLLMAKRLWAIFAAERKRDAINMPPFEDMMKGALDQLLDPQKGLPPEVAARLRARLNLPAPAPSTNNPALK